MKRIVIVFVLGLFVSTSFSQIKWGFYGGFTNSTFVDKTPIIDIGGLTTNTEEPHYMLETFHIGGYIKHQVLRNFFLETGMNYENRGFVKDAYYEPINADYRFKYKIPYLGIPLNLNYYLVNKRFKLYILAGQKVGLCFDGKRVDAGLTTGTINGMNVDDIDFGVEEIPIGKDGIYRSFNYDILYGGGIGFGRFYLVGIYNLGIINLSNIDLFDFKSRVFNLSLQIDFSKNNTNVR